MYKIVTIASGIILCFTLGTRIYNEITYEQDIGGHLKLAADANSTALVEKQLALAIGGMERRSLCNGKGDNCFTSILYRTPDEDVGFWRGNIESTYEDLSKMGEEERADNLIESNQLIKVRETLLDAGASGDKVTDPQGISIYPNNATYGFWACLSAFVFGFGAVIWASRI